MVKRGGGRTREGDLSRSGFLMGEDGFRIFEQVSSMF